MIWTTIATGKTPTATALGTQSPSTRRPASSSPSRARCAAPRPSGTSFSARERSVDVVGWWATWPAETVRGSIVSDHFAYHFLMEDSSDGAGGAGKVSPPGLEARIAPALKRPQDVTAGRSSPGS